MLQKIRDSLPYWVLEMHVDGFRFDCNAHHEPLRFTLPAPACGPRWQVELQTGPSPAIGTRFDAHADVLVDDRSLVLLRRVD